jgi:hypothetical protein
MRIVNNAVRLTSWNICPCFEERLALLVIPLIVTDLSQLTVPQDWLWWIGGGLALLGLAGMELVIRRWAGRTKHAARP